MKSLLLVLLVLLTSCAFFSPYQSHQEKFYPLITADNLKDSGYESFNSEDVKSILTKETSLAGGTYIVSAFPVTKTYLNALTNELTKERSLNKSQASKLKKKYYNNYIKNKTCIQFSYVATRYNKVKYLSGWDLELDYQKVSRKLTFKKSDLTKEPINNKKRIGNDILDQWSNTAIACTKSYEPLKEEFHVKVTPRFVPFPFDSNTTLKWEFDHIKVVDGKEVKVESSNSSYQPYRGW
tara:strand:- start:64203 stop:64916 length:714 start_codon:yes stop_codon:yes gene_type:complete